jgi:membrane-associated phospholipid phosphatase
MSLWDFVTYFGDSAVTVPLSLLVLVFLLAAAVVIGALKLVFRACGSVITTAHIVSPSGHTAMSTAVYGALALLIGGRFPPRSRRALALVAAIVIVAIGWSRVVLHDHSRAEILVGFLVGAGALALFRAMLGHPRRRPCHSNGCCSVVRCWLRSCMARAGWSSRRYTGWPGISGWLCLGAARRTEFRWLCR